MSHGRDTSIVAGAELWGRVGVLSVVTMLLAAGISREPLPEGTQ